ncbi:MAG TPA: VanW family protein, partial [Mycobacteriales bacterium]|nr:VanW family protein [Mycobacteriales bacterium]
MPSRRRVLLLSGGAAVVLVAGGLATAVAAAPGDRVARGVQVGAVDLSGLRLAEAERRIAEGLSGEVASPVALVADDDVLTLQPDDAGLALDAAATAQEALDAGLLDRLRGLVGAQRQVLPVVRADGARLRAAVDEAAEGFDREPREGSIGFEGLEPVPVEPLPGRRVDRDGTVEAVLAQWPLSQRVEVPVEELEVRTTADDVERALVKLAEPAVAAPVTVEGERGSFDVTPEQIAAALRFEADDDGDLRPVVDGREVLTRTTAARRGLEDAAVDATFDTSSGTPVVVPSQTGRGFGADDVARALEEVLGDDAPRRVEVAFSTTQPRVTTEMAEGLGVVEEISSYTSRFPCCAPRVTNIRRIAEIVDGHVVLPGEVFDLNTHVGPRDTARGFVPAPQILRGEFVDDVGGGVSQFATALFNAYFFAGLEDVEHTPHSYYISRYPPGREATISWPEPDLAFRNDSPHGVLIRATTTGTSVTVSMWGTKRFDVRAIEGPRTRETDAETRYISRAGCQPGSGGRGFDITVTRVFEQDGREVRREQFETRYLPQPRFVCGPPPSRAPAPPADPAPPPADPAPPAA